MELMLIILVVAACMKVLEVEVTNFLGCMLMTLGLPLLVAPVGIMAGIWCLTDGYYAAGGIILGYYVVAWAVLWILHWQEECKLSGQPFVPHKARHWIGATIGGGAVLFAAFAIVDRFVTIGGLQILSHIILGV